MPRKTKRKTSLHQVQRGRPRKFVAPEALLSPEEGGSAMPKKYKVRKETLVPAKEKTKVRHFNPSTSDRVYSLDEVEFMNALEEFKRTSRRLFPSCSEILGVLRTLGYEKAVRAEPESTEP